MNKRKLNYNLILGAALIAVVLIPVLIGLFWLPYAPDEMNVTLINSAPSLNHLLGTDNFGRDILSRLMSGTATTVLVGICTVAIGLGAGILIGAVTGYFGGIADVLLMRLNDGLASFPGILLALIAVSVIGMGKYNIVAALGIIFIPSIARIVRSEYVKEKELDYVTNARLMGAGSFRIIFIHILPNIKNVLLSTSVIAFNNAVLAEASMSYLGLGVQPPDASLGRMLSEAQGYMIGSPWYAFSPGLTIIVLVFGISLVGSVLESDGGEEIGRLKHRLKVGRLDGGKSAKKPEGEAGEEANEEVLMSFENWSVGFEAENGVNEVLHNVTFSISRGEMIGIAGESGSGKSMTAYSSLSLLPEAAVVQGGCIRFCGRNTEELEEEELRELRGGEIGFIYQEPMTSLNPVLTIGKQTEEVLYNHKGRAQRLIDDYNRANDSSFDFEQAVECLAKDALKEAELEDVENLYTKYPHELSGGMRQRVMIAMAILSRPQLIIADEPTTALDVSTQARILKLLKEINSRYGTAILLISHNLEVIRRVCSRAMIMQDGRIIEQGKVEDIFEAPCEDYTKKLMEAARLLQTGVAQAEELESGVAQAEELQTGVAQTEELKSGVAQAEELESGVAQTEELETGGAQAEELGTGRRKAEEYRNRYRQAADTKMSNGSGSQGRDGEGCLVKLQNAELFYNERGKGFFARRHRHQVGFDISMYVRKGESVGIVGESGSGKTTLVRAVTGLLKGKEGSVETAADLRPQMVFQDPFGSLNPAKSVGWLLEEPLKISGVRSKTERRKRALEMLEKVELPEEFYKRKVRELSGGQRQRVAIGLCLIQKQELIVLDEPVSALDVTIQVQVLELLRKLREEYRMAYLFISHDIGLVQGMCERVYVMYKGRIVEEGRTAEVFAYPKHDYTKELLSMRKIQ